MTIYGKEDGTSKIVWIIIGASIVYILLKGRNSIQTTSQTKTQSTHDWKPLDKIPSIDDLNILPLKKPVINEQLQLEKPVINEQQILTEKIERLEAIVNRIEQLQIAAQTRLAPTVQNHLPEKDNHSPIVKVENTVPIPPIPTAKVENITELITEPIQIAKVENTVPIPPIPIVKVEMIDINTPESTPIVKVEKVEAPSHVIPVKENIPIVDKPETPERPTYSYKNNEKWKVLRNKKGDIVSLEVIRDSKINDDNKK